jgi:CheY-like chemotaxis protein
LPVPFDWEPPMPETVSLASVLVVAALGVAIGITIGIATSLALARRREPGEKTREAPTRVDASPTPAIAQGVPAPRASGDAHSTPAPRAPGLAADVLVVDDSAVARVKLRRLLEGHGYTVHLASDGVEALALLDQGQYALMISDLEMPNMDGVTLIHTCLGRPRSARMPILAISGHENLRARFNACRDICGVHRKPWVDDVLISHVAALVGTRRPPPPSDRRHAVPAAGAARTAVTA